MNASTPAIGTPETLAVVAGRQISLLGLLSLPGYAAGAVLSHGPVRWMLATVAVLFAIAAVARARPLRPSEAPAGALTCVVVIVMWAWLIPQAPLLAIGSLLASTMYLALMAPRPHAEIGLGTLTVAYLVSQLTLAAGSASSLERAAIAAMVLGLGSLLLSLRITTERKATEHTAALTAANARLDQLHRTDPLTGLANRRELDARLADAWAAAAATGEAVGVLMIDIDHFKPYNDLYGHLTGDHCLRKVAEAVAAGSGGGLAARYGGEEFTIVLPGADLDAGRQAAELVRSNVARLEEPHGGAPGGFVTVSVGVASARPGSGGSVEALVRHADRSLYHAKRDGRNRIGAAVTVTDGAGRDS